MVILRALHDIGSSLMFYGALLAMLYVATGRLSFVIVGVVAVRGRVLVPRDSHPAHPRARRGLAASASIRMLYNKIGGSFQIANSMFAQAAGGLFGQGFGQAMLTMPGGTTAVAGPADRHDLCGHHRRARSVRRDARCS